MTCLTAVGAVREKGERVWWDPSLHCQTGARHSLHRCAVWAAARMLLPALLLPLLLPDTHNQAACPPAARLPRYTLHTEIRLCDGFIYI